ncbi:ubiquitin carboxyl-hydrolase [Proteus sp. G2671]|uniref:terminase small subunit-like protein n=1 Tax=Proteus sp. G2671 TaxID=2698883 RepID=UPI001376C5D3|nr:ubiquitin carboxyl-hydrolase [Proteus sp. G2671]NBM04344.1 ubiquitin carboxyl-hydrolase [Proteus sp. G2671]
MATEKKMGRPSDYLPEVADDVCALIADGESLRTVCKRPGMPNTTKVMRWLREYPDFREQYAKAMESRADAVFEELFDIADDVKEEPAAVAKARLRIDTRKWALARMSPKKYGDKVTQDIDLKSSDGSMSPTKIVLVAGGSNDGSED